MRLMMDVILRRAVRTVPAFVWNLMTRPWIAVLAIVTVVKEAGVEKTPTVMDTVCLLLDRVKAVAVLPRHGTWNGVTQRRITVHLKAMRLCLALPESVHRIV